MNRYFSFFCLLLLGACSQSKNIRLEEALSWIPQDNVHVGFDDWKQIKTDFGFTHESLISLKWMPQTVNDFGEEISAEKLKDNFSAYVPSHFMSYTASPGTIDRIDIRYPDLEWEIMGTNFTHVFKFNSDYNRKGLDSLLEALDYTQSKYGEYTVFYHKQDPYAYPNAQWFALCSAVCYVEKDHVLLTAPQMDFLKQNLDAHTQNKNYLKNVNVSDILSHFKEAESVWLSMDPPSTDPARMILGQRATAGMVEEIRHNLHTNLGLSQEELKTLHRAEMTAIGEKKNGKVIAVLSYPTNQEASDDREKRLHILQHGKSFRTKMKLSQLFFSPTATSSGKSLVLEWFTEPCLIDITNSIFYQDQPWFIYPFDNKP